MSRATRTSAIVEPDSRTPECPAALPFASPGSGAVGVASAVSDDSDDSDDSVAIVSRAP